MYSLFYKAVASPFLEPRHAHLTTKCVDSLSRCHETLSGHWCSLYRRPRRPPVDGTVCCFRSMFARLCSSCVTHSHLVLRFSGGGYWWASFKSAGRAASPRLTAGGVGATSRSRMFCLCSPYLVLSSCCSSSVVAVVGRRHLVNTRDTFLFVPCVFCFKFVVEGPAVVEVTPAKNGKKSVAGREASRGKYARGGRYVVVGRRHPRFLPGSRT